MELIGGIILLLILLAFSKFLPDVSPVPRGKDLRAVIRSEPLPDDYDDYVGLGSRINPKD